MEAAETGHFDDLIAFMTFKELVTKIGLTPRVWKFEGELARATFNADTIGAALNRPVTLGDLGTNTLVIGSVGAATLGGSNLGLGEITLADGTTVQGIGVAGGGTAILSSTASGGMNGLFGFQFGMPVRHLGIALAGFGKNGSFSEQVRFTFYNVSGSTFMQLGAQVVKYACLATGDFTTLSVQPTVAGTFNAVLVEPRPSTDGSTTGPTAFLVSQAMACSATATSCYPPMATPLPLPAGLTSNRC